MKSFSVNVGDRVAYSVQFLRAIGVHSGDMAHARGTVKEVIRGMAVIQWDAYADSLPNTVNVQNLALVGPNTRFCNCD